MKTRYKQILRVIADVKPKTIVETGTWNGDRAIEMATEALKHQEEVKYLGFDLFEDATEDTDSRELNVKSHFSQAYVQKKFETFQSNNPGFSYRLIKGDTNETLKPMSVDFVFIDGGHSVDTVKNDFEKLKESKVVVLDDYYEPENGHPDIERFGCNKVLEGVDHVIFSETDPVRDGGLVRLAATGVQPAKTRLNVKTRNCVQDENIIKNVEYAITKGISFVPECTPHGERAVIVGSGPSTKEHLDILRERQKDSCVFAAKSAHHLLIENGIIPFGCILLDPRTDVLPWITPFHPDILYFVASMCHPEVWDHLSEARMMGYHALVGAGETEVIKTAHGKEIKRAYKEITTKALNGSKKADLIALAKERDEVLRGRFGRGGFLVSGGTTAIIRGICLVHAMGFRNITLVGADSCYFEKPDLSEKDKLGRDRFLKVEIAGKKFWTDLQLLAQMQDIERLIKQGNDLNLQIVGDGMLKKVLDIHNSGKQEFADVFGQVDGQPS